MRDLGKLKLYNRRILVMDEVDDQSSGLVMQSNYQKDSCVARVIMVADDTPVEFFKLPRVVYRRQYVTTIMLTDDDGIEKKYGIIDPEDIIAAFEDESGT